MVAQSPEPRAHVLNARAFRIELEFRNVGFCGEGKTGVPREKPLGAEKRTNNKLNPHMTSKMNMLLWKNKGEKDFLVSVWYIPETVVVFSLEPK